MPQEVKYVVLQLGSGHDLDLSRELALGVIACRHGQDTEILKLVKITPVYVPSRYIYMAPQPKQSVRGNGTRGYVPHL